MITDSESIDSKIKILRSSENDDDLDMCLSRVNIMYQTNFKRVVVVGKEITETKETTTSFYETYYTVFQDIKENLTFEGNMFVFGGKAYLSEPYKSAFQSYAKLRYLEEL